MDPSQPTEVRTAGLRAVRRYHEGSLAFHERRAEVRFVVEAGTGRLVMPVEPTLARGDGEEMTLWMPAESGWDVHAALVTSLIDRPEACEAVDRWAAYHGRTSLTAWARCRVEGLKSRDHVWDGESVEAPNPLGRAEYALIRRVNADLPGLVLACKRHAAAALADPLCVGVDPFGIDVRARFGIIRLEFPPGIEARTPSQAETQVDHLLGRGGVC